MIEIQLLGRGGQGIVTAGYLLAYAAFKKGFWVQAFPTFGTERRGAPVSSFVRLDDKPIFLRSQIGEPDYLIIIDPSLIDYGKRIKAKKVFCNSPTKIEGWECIDFTSYKWANIPMITFFIKRTGLGDLDGLKEGIREVFELKPKIMEYNLKLVDEIWKLI